MKTYLAGTHQKRLNELWSASPRRCKNVPASCNICFHGKIRKNIDTFGLQNKHLIKSCCTDIFSAFSTKKGTKRKVQGVPQSQKKPFPDTKRKRKPTIQTSTNRTSVRKALRLALYSPNVNLFWGNSFEVPCQCTSNEYSQCLLKKKKKKKKEKKSK